MLRLDRLSSSLRIVGPDGFPTTEFITYWQKHCNAIEASVNGIQEALEAAAAANAAADTANAAAVGAQGAADTAQAAAMTAQGAADTTTAATSLANSYPSGVTITATDAGASATITVSTHSRVYGDGTTVGVAGGTVTGLAYSTAFYVYYDDPTRAGGAVTYLATTDETVAAQIGDRHVVGAAMTPAAAGAPSGGRSVRPPGSGTVNLA